MKGKVILLTALLLVLLAMSLQAAPRMTMNESMFNFGYVPQNSKIAHSFWLHSTGDDSLKILKVIPG